VLCGVALRWLAADLHIFLGRAVLGFLQGVLGKTGGKTWFFDGEFVVDLW
jgi:hypothetical protein